MNACMPVICRKIDEFKVQGHACNETVNLATLYSRPEFQNDRSHLPSANICYQLDHLKNIATKLLPLQNVESKLVSFLVMMQVMCTNLRKWSQQKFFFWSLRYSNPTRLVHYWLLDPLAAQNSFFAKKIVHRANSGCLQIWSWRSSSQGSYSCF